MKKTLGILSILLLIGLNIGFIPNVTAAVELQVSFTENPIVVAPGSNGYIELTLKNTGSDPVNYIDITPDILDYSIIQFQGNWDVYVGTLDQGESTTIIYEFSIASSADPGLYQIIFETDSSASDTKVTAFIRVEDSSIIDIESVTPSLINIGEVSTLIFNLSNNGGKSVSSIMFTWEDENDLILPIGSDNRLSIDLIPANDNIEIPIVVMASPAITPGVYPLMVTMIYADDSGSTQTISSNVGIQVSGGTDFEIILQQSLSGSTTFAVANTGANTASSVIVSIPRQPNYSTTGASSVSLGNLDAGDYTLASFQLTSMNQNTTSKPAFNRDTSDMPTDFDPSMFEELRNRTNADTMGTSLLVEISYTDLYGLRQTVEKEVEISSISSSSTIDKTSRFGASGMTNMQGQQDSGLSTGTLYIIVGFVGILLIVALLQIGKKKKIPYFSKIYERKKQ